MHVVNLGEGVSVLDSQGIQPTLWRGGTGSQMQSRKSGGENGPAELLGSTHRRRELGLATPRDLICADLEQGDHGSERDEGRR